VASSCRGALETMVLYNQVLFPYTGIPIYRALNVADSSTHLIHYSQQVAKGFLWTPSGQEAAEASQNPTPS
jgi:hypothetical protein